MTMIPDSYDRDPTDPTPDQIRARAAEVRRAWSARVMKSRRVHARQPWAPPLVMTIQMLRELNARNE